MSKSTIHAELEDRVHVDVSGINSCLSRLAGLSERSLYLGDFLNRALLSLYRSLPGGEENYGYGHAIHEDSPKIGIMAFDFEGEGNNSARLIYGPTGESRERYRYISKGIGRVWFRENNYHMGTYDLPIKLVEDTEKVMALLGLRKN